MSDFIYFPKIGKSFPNIVGIIRNIVRHHYESSEIAYMDVYGLNKPPVCRVCGDNRKYLTFTKGYSALCGKRSCSNIDRKLNKKRPKTSDDGFYRHMIENYEFYLDVYLNNKSYYDPYYKKVIKNTVKKFITNKIPAEKRIVVRKCKITGVDYESDLFPKNPYDLVVAKNDSLKAIKSKFSYTEIERIMKLFEKFDEPDSVDELKKTPNIRLFYRFIDKTKVKTLMAKDKPNTWKGSEFEFNGKTYESGHSISNTNERNLNLYVSLDELDELFGIYKTCVVCDKKYDYYKVIYNLDTQKAIKKKVKGKYTCSRDCYHRLLKSDKDSYYEYSEKSKISQSMKIKNKIQSGEFTPNITNSWCKSRVKSIDGTKHFRSTWEAVYWVYNRHLMYETVRVPYIWKGDRHIYILDFEDRKSKIIYEIKPKSKMKEREKVKAQSAILWAKKNDYTFKIIDDSWFHFHVNEETLKEVLLYVDIDYSLLRKRMREFL